MATQPLRRPLDQEFSDRYDRNTFFAANTNSEPQPQRTSERIQNTQVAVANTTTVQAPNTSRRASRGERKAKRQQGLTSANNGDAPLIKGIPTPKKIKRALSYGSMLVADMWATFLSTIATIFGISILIGASAILAFEATVGTGTFASIIEYFAGWFGTTRDSLYTFFYIYVSIYYVLIFIMFWSCYKIMSFAGAKPLSGQMATFKYTTFILAIVISLLPGGTIVPTITLWLWFVAHYPN